MAKNNTIRSEKPKGHNGQQTAARIANWPKRTNYADHTQTIVPSDILDTLRVMLCDLRNLQPGYGYADYTRDDETLSRRFSAEGVKFATHTLPLFFDGLIGYLETGQSVFPFKRMKGRYPHFLRGLVAPIYADPHSDVAVKNIELVYQFCVAFKKLKGPYEKRVLREQLTDFINNDMVLGYIYISSYALRDVARSARQIITKLLSGLNPFDRDQAELFLPRPGPGATNTSRERHLRFRPRVLYSKLNDVFPCDEWFAPPFAQPRSFRVQRYAGDTQRLRRRKSFRLKTPISPSPPTSRFEFVPKTYAKPRGICIEENEVQWLQQALRSALYQRVESHPITKGKVNFTSQVCNGKLALEGSLTKEWVTIDLSSASDLIARHLIAYLFGGNKPLLDAILAVSTEDITLPRTVPGLPVRGTLPVKKIAPMGSAVCFPLMALTIFALIRAILDSSEAPREDTREVYIYGDDIIVKSTCAQAVYDWLPMFGMKINTDKSFRFSHFRESCGVHAYRGVDITPTRFKNCITSNTCPADFAGSLRLEEAFYNKGYLLTAERFRKTLQKVATERHVGKLPYVDTESQLLGFFRDRRGALLCEFAKHTKRRWWDLALNEWLYEVHVIKDFFEREPPIVREEDRYLRSLLLNSAQDAKYVYGYSKRTNFVRVVLPESALGYRCSPRS